MKSRPIKMSAIAMGVAMVVAKGIAMGVGMSVAQGVGMGVPMNVTPIGFFDGCRDRCCNG